jgi:hypothetical protein
MSGSRQQRSFAFESQRRRAASRLFASAEVISRAEEVIQRIAEIYRLPNRDFRNPDRQPDDVDCLGF